MILFLGYSNWFDWNAWEVQQIAEYPLLEELQGWRYREVRDYCISQKELWDAQRAAYYGYPGAVI